MIVRYMQRDLSRFYDTCSCGKQKRKGAVRCRYCHADARRIDRSRTCPFCGTAFEAYDSRLVYCSKECSDDNLRVTRRGTGNPNWKDNPSDSWSTGHQRAVSLHALQPCEVCGSEKSERHHKDSDPMNNSRSNIMFLCRRHHMIEDGRMDALLALNASRSKTA